MRVTIDCDTKNIFIVLWVFIKGVYLCKRLPFLFRFTRKGFHIAWINLNIDDRTMFKYRELIGDDKKRILLDKKRKFATRQVLFTHKTIYGFLNGERVLISRR